jgi:GNAT superfamily N-acetyltransferase
LTEGSRDVYLEIPVEAAWAALLAPERHRWYYRLTPQGTFAEGNAIRWVDGSGNAAEESEVVQLVAPERLVLATRFVYAPIFAQQPAHTLTWEVDAEGSGCRVRMSWQATELVGGLLASEADGVMQGLRLEHDPAAQAEIARLPQIGEINVRDVTPDRLADYQAFFDRDAFRDFPGWQSCYCMETHRDQADSEWAVRTAGDNRRDMSRLISEGGVTALLAYVDDQAVGWCNYGETTRLHGVMRRFGLDAAEHEGVGSLACFVIAAPYRGHGVATSLLDGALGRLRARGVRVAEAYPAKKLDSAQANYRGPLSMYLRAGFEPYRESERHVVVRKAL